MTNSGSAIQSWHYTIDDSLTALAISGAGDRIILGTENKRVVVLDGQGESLWQAEVGNQVEQVALDAEGEIAVVGTGQRRFWNRKGRGVFCFSGNGSLHWEADLGASVEKLAVAEDGKLVLSLSDDQQLSCFDEQGAVLWQRKGPNQQSCLLTPDGETVLRIGFENQIQLLDRCGVEWQGFHTETEMETVALSDDGKVLLACGKNGNIYRFEPQGDLIWEKQAEAETVSLNGLASHLLLREKNQNRVLCYTVDGELLWQQDVEGYPHHLQVSATGQRFAAGTDKGHCYLWDESGETLLSEQPGESIQSLLLSNFGEKMIVAVAENLIVGYQLPRPIIKTPAVTLQEAYEAGVAHWRELTERIEAVIAGLQQEPEDESYRQILSRRQVDLEVRRGMQAVQLEQMEKELGLD